MRNKLFPAQSVLLERIRCAGGVAFMARDCRDVLRELVQCAALFCTYPAVATKAALARVTLARMSLALAVQMNGLGSML